MKRVFFAIFAAIVAVSNAAPAFAALPSDFTWGTVGTDSQYLESLAASSDGTKIVAMGYQTIVRSIDGGATWQDVAGPDPVNDDWAGVVATSDGSRFIATNYNDGLVYESTDVGLTWTALPSTGLGGNGDRLRASSDGTKLVTWGYFDIYKSVDGGSTWSVLPNANGSNYYQDVYISDDGMHLTAISSTLRISTSSDGGVTWTTQAGASSIDIGFPSHLSVSKDGSKMMLNDQSVGQTIYTSSDYGVTWTAHPSLDLVYPNQRDILQVSPDGSKMIVADYSSGDYHVSTDDGAT